METVKIDHLTFNGIKKVMLDEATFNKMQTLLEDNQLVKYMNEVKEEDSVPMETAKKKFKKMLDD